MTAKIVKRRTLLTVVVIAALSALLIGTALVGNDFRFRQESVVIPGPDGDLNGVLTLPTNGEARGLVVMVHGDGPVEATQGGLYAPWFEGAADAGFASLSWSKPGVAGSEGDWLGQSMQDRAHEVGAALDWAQGREDVQTETIVLWGASQAGWVLPQVVSAREDIDAVVAVGTAINWLRQGRFNLLAELDRDGASTEEREAAIAESDRTLEMLDGDASYQEYLASSSVEDPMTAARWDFVRRNFAADATDDLFAAATREIPVLLLVGEHDRNVDVAETQATYETIFGPRLTVERVDGAHSLARPMMEDNKLAGLATGIIWPRSLLAPGTIDTYRAFLQSVD